MPARTDIHRPSAVEFDPAAYECAGVFDLHPEEGDHRRRSSAVSSLTGRGYRFASHQGIGQCGHCGARIRYAALLTHEASRELIYVGEICLGSRLESLTKVEFQALREFARLNRERSSRRERIAALCEANPGLAEVTYAPVCPWVGGFVADVAGRLQRDGVLSDRQVAAVIAAFQRDAAREEARLEREAARCSTAVPAPSGRVEVVGAVYATRVTYGAWGRQEKFGVRHADGWRVWCTIPSDLADVVADVAELRSREVAFTATLVPKVEDPTFAFGSRPARGVLR